MNTMRFAMKKISGKTKHIQCGMHMQIESINIEKIIEDTWESNRHNFYFMTIL